MDCGPEKRVLAVVRKCPNYFFHLLALARIRYDSEYADRFGDTILPDDIAYLQNLRDALSIGMRTGGELTFIIGFPIYFNLESRDELEEFFALINLGIESDDFGSFFRRYDYFIERLNLWAQFGGDDFAALKHYKDNITHIGKIVLHYYNEYESAVWPSQKNKMIDVAAGIDAHFKNRNVINVWEKLTGIEYKLDCFNAILCTATKNGPDANSIGYDCVVFYYDRPIDELAQIISHEIGTHLLFDDYKYLTAKEGMEHDLLYYAYESLAKYLNSIVLNNDNLKYDLPGFYYAEFKNVYLGLIDEDGGISVRDLMAKAIERFQRKNP